MSFFYYYFIGKSISVVYLLPFLKDPVWLGLFNKQRCNLILLDTKPDSMTAAVLNSYGRCFSSGTQ